MNNAQLGAARLLELKAIAKKNHGVLQPEDVVEHAKSEKSALHSAFDWDDTHAAHMWRIDQARGIIQVAVEIIATKREDIEVRAFLAPISDRKENGEGGYRLMTGLLKNKQGRREILETALAELDSFRKKYIFLAELVKIFMAIDEVRNRAR